VHGRAIEGGAVGLLQFLGASLDLLRPMTVSGSTLSSTLGGDQARLTERARQELNNRRRRARIFPGAMFGEPAWDMLLILYLEHVRSRITVSQLTRESGAAQTTALRWIEYLESQQLIRRYAHPTDRRIAYLDLTDKAIQSLETFLSETLSAEA
jgi:DNA-binding MarR family transcriptional regulator